MRREQVQPRTGCPTQPQLSPRWWTLHLPAHATPGEAGGPHGTMVLGLRMCPSRPRAANKRANNTPAVRGDLETPGHQVSVPS
jgi:hypothetical protein